MALSFSVDSLDAVPEAFRSEYTEANGKFILNVDGAVAKARVDEFRTNNVALKRQMDEMNARFEGVDPDVFRELSTQATKLRDKKLVDSGKFDELMAARIESMKTEHDRQVAALTAERNGAKSQLDSLLIDGGLRDAAAKAGVRSTAVDDILLRGRQTFRLVEGKPTAFAGETQLYGTDSEPLGFGAWVTGLAKSAPHLFEGTGGGNAPKGGSVPASGKTMSRATWNGLGAVEKQAAARTMKIVD